MKLDGFGNANLAKARKSQSGVRGPIDYRLLAETAEDKKKEASQEALDAIGYYETQIKAATRALPDEAVAIGREVPPAGRCCLAPEIGSRQFADGRLRQALGGLRSRKRKEKRPLRARLEVSMPETHAAALATRPNR